MNGGIPTWRSTTQPSPATYQKSAVDGEEWISALPTQLATCITDGTKKAPK
jgi:hypothetical protein